MEEVKSIKHFKINFMDLGDFVSCQYEYDDTETEKNTYWCWKDIYIIYFSKIVLLPMKFYRDFI